MKPSANSSQQQEQGDHISRYANEHVASAISSPFFERLFSVLPPCSCSHQYRQGIADLLTSQPAPEGEQEGSLPAGYFFLKLLIEHDLTFSLYHSQSTRAPFSNANQAIVPSLQLLTIYGSDPDGQPYLYNAEDPAKFLLVEDDQTDKLHLPVNNQNLPLLADPRNLQHPVLRELHIQLCYFHNKVVDYLRAKGLKNNEFSEAQKLVRWHYHWLILNDFLPRLCSESTHHHIKSFAPDPRQVQPIIPLPPEFLMAAFRIDGSLVDAAQSDGEKTGQAANGEQHLAGRSGIDWWNYFPVEHDEVYNGASISISSVSDNNGNDHFPLPKLGNHSSPFALLELGEQFALPSGEALSRIFGVEPMSKNQLETIDLLRECNPNANFYEISHLETPLLYYLLKEAEVHEKGQRLGETGSRVVLETFLNVLGNDPNSYLLLHPKWKPIFGSTNTSFDMSDLIKFTEVGEKKRKRNQQNLTQKQSRIML